MKPSGDSHCVQASWEFPAAATNATRRLPRFTTAYTSLVGTGPASGVLVYGVGIRCFALPFSLGSDAEGATPVAANV